MSLVPDHHNKANIAINQVTNFLVSDAYKNYVYTTVC